MTFNVSMYLSCFAGFCVFFGFDNPTYLVSWMFKDFRFVGLIWVLIVSLEICCWWLLWFLLPKCRVVSFWF